MAIYAKLFDTPYQFRPKNTGALEPVRGQTLVTEMGPEDLPRLDPATIASYASPANARWAQRVVTGRGQYWGDIASNADLSAMIADGWEAGAALVADLSSEVADLIPVPAGPRRRLRWQDHGDEVSMERVYGGQLDTAWRASPRQRERAPRVISIDVDVGQNCYLTADALKWSGIAAVALTDALEAAGYRCELFSSSAMKSNTPDGGAALTRLVVKRAMDPVNVGLVAALAAHPATFRWYHVMSWLAHPESVGAGYGQSVALPEVLEAGMVAGLVEGAEVQLGGAFTRADAVAQITAVVQRLEAEERTAVGTMI